MKVMLRSDAMPDVLVCTAEKGESGSWELCSEKALEQHIRTLQAALAWLKDENIRKENAMSVAGTNLVKGSKQ